MRFLVDEALQDLVADRLIEAGHDATHVREIDRVRLRRLPIDDG